ncbi:nucleoside monophosphate kinase [Acetobacteraceae bacterium]|nr:nucleoside monophosphate kinase [Candidatus Parcubacteria bacterium]
MNQQTVIFLGPQGSGKGTQLELLKQHLNKSDPDRKVVHFDMGAAFRGFRDTEGYSQAIVKDSLARGEIQPDFLATALFGNFLIENLKGNEHLLLDGFPRTLAQVEEYNSAIKFYNRGTSTVLHLNLSEAASIERLMKRGRHDDTEELIRHRLAWYQEQVIPALNYFRANPLYRVMEVNSDQPIETVHQDIVHMVG